jgi:hypothetical protein
MVTGDVHNIDAWGGIAARKDVREDRLRAQQFFYQFNKYC